MAAYTENLNLKKPDKTDFVDIKDINENMDAVDSAITENMQKIKELEDSLTTLPPSAPPTFEIGEDGHLYAIYEED
ncbi:MAG: hypothetical protein HFJ98_00555 [Eubacterium sp.]|nr:hypothetical protein [Eubacterium sp.]